MAGEFGEKATECSVVRVRRIKACLLNLRTGIKCVAVVKIVLVKVSLLLS